MECFLEMKFLLRNPMTFKQKPNQYDEVKMEKMKSGIWTLIQLGNAFCTPGHCKNPRTLAKPDCWNHPHVFYFTVIYTPALFVV